MKKERRLLCLLMFIFICFSCENSSLEGRYEMSIALPEDLPEVSFAQEGGSQTILLTANNNWAANVSNTEDEQWVTINLKEGGAGENQEIVITTLENPEKKYRESEIIVVCGNKPMKVAIRQTQLSEIAIPEDNKKLTFSKSTPSIVVEIDSNVDVEIEIATELPTEQQWLFCVPTPIVSPAMKGLKKKRFTITTNDNYGEERGGEVIFKNTETESRDTITVTQETEEVIFAQGEDEYVLKYNETNTPDVILDANVEITPIIIYSQEDAIEQIDWLTVVPVVPIASSAAAPVVSQTHGLVATAFSIIATENPESSDRTAIIRFENAIDNTTYDEVTVKQLRRGTIVITTPESPTASISGEVQDYQVTIKSTDIEEIKVIISDVTAGADGDQEWISYDANTPPIAVDDEEGAYIYSFQVKRNGATTRNAKITFSDINDANISDNIEITQQMKQDQLNIELISPDSNWDQSTNNPINANPFAGTEYKFQITTDIAWSVRGDNDVFVTIDKSGSSAATNQEIVVSIPVNTASPESAEREISLTFNSGDNTKLVKIIQKDSKVKVVLLSAGLETAITGYSTYATTDVIRYLTVTSVSGSASAIFGQPGIRAETGASLDADDFAYMKLITNLMYLDISGTRVNTAVNAIIPAGLGYVNPSDATDVGDAHKKIETIVLWSNVPAAMNGGSRLIPANAFANCINLKTINFPENLTNIGGSAFLKANLLGPEISFPVTITGIGAKAFMQCPALTTVIINAPTPPTISAATNGGNRSFDPQSSPFVDVNPKFYVPDATAVTAYKTVTAANKNTFWPHARYKDRIFPQSDLNN